MRDKAVMWSNLPMKVQKYFDLIVTFLTLLRSADAWRTEFTNPLFSLLLASLFFTEKQKLCTKFLN